ncbi:MAG: hypothetical protein H0U69_01010 [Trueperaceae bacterium]|nr:hypothetical protein [Trueperaceae bacterium]
MAQDPKHRVDPKVGAYGKPDKSGAGSGPIIGIVVAIIVVLLLLWQFTDII